MQSHERNLLPSTNLPVPTRDRERCLSAQCQHETESCLNKKPSCTCSSKMKTKCLQASLWSEPTLLRVKLYGSLEELRRTVAFAGRKVSLSSIRQKRKKKKPYQPERSNDASTCLLTPACRNKTWKEKV